MFLRFLIGITFFTSTSYASIKEPGHSKILQTTIPNYMKSHEVPGMACGIYDNGWEEIATFGFKTFDPPAKVTATSLFQIASITKVFTSTLLALEVIEGRMELNDPLTKYLPQLNSNPYLRSVTLFHLATHTSALPRNLTDDYGAVKYDLEAAFRALGGFKLSLEPGSRYIYSNIGYALLGEAIASREQDSYQKVLERKILIPLEMNSTFVRVPEGAAGQMAQGFNKKGIPVSQRPAQVMPGGGGLRSTVADLMKFLKANLGVSGPDNLKKAMQDAQKRRFTVSSTLSIGLGWQQVIAKNETLIIEKNGGVPGFSSYIGMIPSQKIGVVLLTNKGKGRISKIGRKVLLELAAHKVD